MQQQWDMLPGGSTGTTTGRTGTMRTGRWYAVAFDTDPFPSQLALDAIEARLAELHVGSIRLYQQREDVPATVPAAVRDAPGADVWATGQYLGADVSAPLPEQVLALAELPAPSAPVPVPREPPTPPVPRPRGQPAPPGPRHPPAPAPAPKPIATSTLLGIGIGSIVVIGGGIALVMYLRRPRRNPRRARRRRRR